MGSLEGNEPEYYYARSVGEWTVMQNSDPGPGTLTQV